MAEDYFMGYLKNSISREKKNYKLKSLHTTTTYLWAYMPHTTPEHSQICMNGNMSSKDNLFLLHFIHIYTNTCVYVSVYVAYILHTDDVFKEI